MGRASVPSSKWINLIIFSSQKDSPVPGMYLIVCNTSTSTNNSCDWIWYELDRFLDGGHISVQTLMHKIIGELVQIWWMPSLTHFQGEFLDWVDLFDRNMT